MSPYHRILVTGATGFLGRHVVQALESAGLAVTAVGSADFDLLQPGAATAMLEATKPDAVFHLAAKVGGIIANRDFPADFLYDNLVINTHTFHACYEAGVKKLISFVGGCSYPALAVSPIGENQMWTGFPQAESAPYSTAKKMLLIQSEAYRRQHQFNSVILIPGNAYGEHDNFNEAYSHVIPALIRRFVEAVDAGRDYVVVYGSGRPVRDFVYAGDVAQLMPWFLEHYDSSSPVNLSSGVRTSIRELAQTVAAAVGFEGTIRWEETKPDGQMDKVFDVKRLQALGLRCETPLDEGVRRTVAWFREARHRQEVRL